MSGRDGRVLRSGAFDVAAIDLDGTLLRPDGTVSRRTQDALTAFQNAGSQVVIVTARSARDVSRIAALYQIGGVAVCANGAVLFNLDDFSTIGETTIPNNVATNFITSLLEEVPGAFFACEAGLDYVREEHFTTLAYEDPPDRMIVRETLELVRPSLIKILVGHSVLSQVELLGIARRLVGDNASVTFSGAELIEVAAAGVNKAAALAVVCDRIGIEAARVVAFGDMPNDVPMLEWAGWSVAVANAHREVLRVADEVTSANADDGVAVVLERLVQEGGL